MKASRKATLAAYLAALALPAALLAWILSLSGRERFHAEAAFQYWALPLLLLFAVAAAVAALRGEKQELKRRGKELALGALFAALLTGLVCMLHEPLFWMQWDEATFFATSLGMRFHRAHWYVAQAGLGEALPTFFAQDHRAPLYPFLVSLAHDLLGVRLPNAFLVNAGVLFALLFSVYAWLQARAGAFTAACAPLLLLASPVLLWCARSGGYDLLFLLLLCLLLAAAERFARKPGEAGLLLVVALGLLLSYARRDGLLAFFLTLAASAWLAWRAAKGAKAKRELLGRLRPLLLLPLGLLPLALLGSATMEGYQGLLRDSYGGAEPFHPGHLPRNILALFRYFFDPRPLAMHTGSLYLAGIGALAWYARRRGLRAPGFLLAAAGVGVPTVLLLAFPFGHAARPEALRLFLPAAAFLSLAPLLLVGLARARRAPLVALVAAVAVCLLRLPAAAERRDETLTYEARAGLAVQEIVTSEQPRLGNALFVAEVPQVFLIVGLPAVHPSRLPEFLPEIARLRAEGHDLRVYFADLFPENASTPVKQAMRGHELREVARSQHPGVSVRLVELVR